MTGGMRIRLWARNAPTSQVVVTTIVATLVLLGLVIVSVPDRGPSAQRAVVGAGGGPVAIAPGTPQGTAPSVTAPVARPGAAPVGPATGSQAEPASGGTARPSEAGAAQGAQGLPGSAPSAAAPAASSAGAPPAEEAPIAPDVGGGAAPEQPAASAQGIAPDTIKVGFLIPDSPVLVAAGFATNSRMDWEDVIRVLVDHANKEGGVNGRKIEHVTTRVDPLDNPSQRNGCITMAQDQKVFAVFDSASTLGVNQMCYPEFGTIYVTTSVQTNSEANYRKAGGYLASSGATGTRVLLNWALLSLDSGFIGPGKGKLGVLSSECPPDPEMIDQEFKPLLEEKGISFLDVRLSCDLGIAQQQIPGAVLQFRQNGVDRILMSVIFATAQVFLQQAEAQSYRPLYSCSDMWGLCLDVFTSNFPPEQFDRARGFTFSHSGEDKAGLPFSEAVQRCDRILKEGGIRGVIDQMGTDAGAVAYCDDLNLFLTAMRRTPTNPTHAYWIKELQEIGEYAAAYANRAVFRPGKFDGGDDYAPVEWRRECSCFHQIGPRVVAPA